MTFYFPNNYEICYIRNSRERENKQRKEKKDTNLLQGLIGICEHFIRKASYSSIAYNYNFHWNYGAIRNRNNS